MRNANITFQHMLIGLAVGAGVGLAPAASAASITVFGDTINSPFLAGDGISNTDFVTNTTIIENQFPVQTAWRARTRWFDDANYVLNEYSSITGNSQTSGGDPTPVAGTTVWNFDLHVNLGEFSLNDVDVLISIDFDPAVGNTDLYTFDLATALLAIDDTIDLSTISLFQDSQNLGFDFWQAIGDPNIKPIDPFATGEYSFLVQVIDPGDSRGGGGGGGSTVISESSMTVIVTPTPGALVLLGFAGICARRRRKS